MFKLEVGGLINPRELNTQVGFEIESQDVAQNLIDKTDNASQFTIMMTETGIIADVDIVSLNERNAALTIYRVTMIPNGSIEIGDSLLIEFPPDIPLPSSAYITCKAERQYVDMVLCSVLTSNTLRIQFLGQVNIPDRQAVYVDV